MSRLRYFLIAIAVLLISILLPELPVISILLRTLDLSIYDTILEVHNAITYSEYKGVYDQICIVDIDEKSIKELGQFSSWPSLFFADLVNTLSADEPVAIAFDVFFTEVRAVPVRHVARIFDQPLKAFASGRIASNFELEQIERLHQLTHFRFGRARASCLTLTDKARADRRRQHANNDDHGQELHQREAALLFLLFACFLFYLAIFINV